jgi:hypothetical protein
VVKSKKRASDSTYVIQDSFQATSRINKRPALLEENNGVEVIAALTQEERLQRNFQEAEKKGNVIDMLDSDGEDDGKDIETPQKRAPVKTPCAEGSRVKLESVSSKRDIPESPLKTPCPSSTKQALGLLDEGDEPLISLKTTTKRTRIERTDGLDAEGDEPLISLKVRTKRTRIDDAHDIAGQGDEPPNANTFEIYPEPAEVTLAVKTITPTPASRKPSSVTPSTPEGSMEEAIIPSSPQEAGVLDVEQFLKNREAGIKGIKQLLRRFDLSEYEDTFVESGYDSVSSLYELAENVDYMEKLAFIVGFKPGHAIRFQCKLLKEAECESTAQNL